MDINVLQKDFTREKERLDRHLSRPFAWALITMLRG